MGSVSLLPPSPRSGASIGFVRRVFDTLQRPKRQCRVFCDEPESDLTTLPGVVQILTRAHASIAGAAGSGTTPLHVLQHQMDDAVALMDVCRCLRNAISELQHYAISVQQAVSILNCKRTTRAAMVHASRALSRLPAVAVAASILDNSSVLRRVEEHCRRAASNNFEDSTCSNAALRDALKATVVVLRQLLPSYNFSGRSSGDAKSLLSELHAAVQVSVNELSCRLHEVLESSVISDAEVGRFADVAYRDAEKLDGCMRNLVSHVNALYGALRDIRVSILG